MTSSGYCNFHGRWITPAEALRLAAWIDDTFGEYPDDDGLEGNRS